MDTRDEGIRPDSEPTLSTKDLGPFAADLAMRAGRTARVISRVPKAFYALSALSCAVFEETKVIADHLDNVVQLIDIGLGERDRHLMRYTRIVD